MLTVFWIRVDITLAQPLKSVVAAGRISKSVVRGAIMSFGVTATDDDAALEVVRNWIDRSEQFQGLEYNVRFDYVGEIEDLQGEIYSDQEIESALIRNPSSLGLWYRTGVGWYDD